MREKQEVALYYGELIIKRCKQPHAKEKSESQAATCSELCKNYTNKAAQEATHMSLELHMLPIQLHG